MLVISRRIGESFVLGDDMEVMVIDITGEKVVLGVAAPPSVPIARTDAPEKVPGESINKRGYGRRQKHKLSEEKERGGDGD